MFTRCPENNCESWVDPYNSPGGICRRCLEARDPAEQQRIRAAYLYEKAMQTHVVSGRDEQPIRGVFADSNRRRDIPLRRAQQ